MAAPFVLLDLDDTLVDRATAIRRIFERLAARAQDPDAEVERLVELDRGGRASRSMLFTQAIARLGLPGEANDLNTWFARAYPEVVPPLAEPTRDALVRLRAAGYGLAIVVNGDRYQEAVIRRTGLDALVDGWVIGEVDLARKPEERAYRLGQQRAGGDAPADGWIVGDDPLEDVLGGRAAGLSTAWIARGRPWQQDGPPPEVVADDVARAVDAILGAS